MIPTKKSKKIEILQKDCPILREISKSISLKDIDSKEIKGVILNLQKAIDSQADAVAISAIQIGKPIRLFVISKRIFSITEDLNKEEKESLKDLIIINPKIIKSSKDKQLIEEGCLSVRYIYGKVSRSSKVTLEYTDENGKKITRGFSGLFAQVVQHENDHLDGILFIDKAVDLQEISKEDYKKGLAELKD